MLKRHLEHCSKHASYASQNELISLAGDDIKN